MTLYCIVNDVDKLANPDSYGLLKQAAESRNITFTPIESAKADTANLPKIAKGDLLYRLSSGKKPRLIEALLIRDDIATLYDSTLALFARGFEWESDIRMQHAGLPVISTFYGENALDADRLLNHTEELGGFPLIVKAANGSHGNAVMRVDSIESLRSVLGYLTDERSTHFVLKKFIRDATHIRCIVLDGNLVDAVQYMPQPNDFRTNAVDKPHVEPYECSDEVRDIAIRSVESLNVAFGGVDVLIDADGTPYIAEVNFPCNFARCQMRTGIDTAGKLVESLVGKSEKLS